MRNLINVMTNRVKYTKEIDFIWDDKTQELVKLNAKDRLDKVEFVGTDKAYRFVLNFTIGSNKDIDTISDSIDIIADSEEEAEEAASKYFLSTYLHRFILAKSRQKKVTLTLDRLLSKEEAEEFDKQMAEFDDFLDSHCCEV